MIRQALIGGFAVALAISTFSAGAQTPDEHASHHPGAAAPSAPVPSGMAANESVGAVPGAAGPPGPAGGGMGGMIRMMGTPPRPEAAYPVGGVNAGGAAPGGGMGAMMGEMMAPKSPSGGCMGGNCGAAAGTTPIYPSLMTLPALTPEKRAELDMLATQQTREGISRLMNGSESLDRARQAGDEAGMQQAVGLMHEALSELEAGIAARRVLTEGKAPRNLALDWFKREMNLASPVVREEPSALLGLSPLHLFTMGLLIAFAFAMLAMYFFKMRRAAALFGRLETDAESPPPGSSPPLGGAAGPSAPLGGKAPPSGQPPPTASSGSGAPAPPAAGEAAAGAPSGLPPPPAAPSASPGESSTPAATATPGVPLTAKWRDRLRVATIVSETALVRTYRLRSTSDVFLPFTFVPGQFLNVAFGIGGALVFDFVVAERAQFR